MALLEVLVAPLRHNDRALIRAYEDLFASADLHPIQIDARILRDAAELRASVNSLRTPDAIHAATARLSGCSTFVTNDKGFGRVPGLPLLMLDDLVGP